jgi:hypothetical protein
MATKEISANTAKFTGKKKPRGKPFTGNNDPRNNRAGQRSREVVQTSAQARALYVQVLHEPISTPPEPTMSNLEMIVRRHVQDAKKGDAQAREQMFDRIWGKANQPIDLTSSDGSMTPQAVMFVPFVNNANASKDSDSA